MELTEVLGDVVPLIEKAVRADGTVDIKVIQAGWGTSGYYSKPVLQRDGPRVFPRGTKMYWDHPTPSDERDRPERSLRDLAGEFVGDAQWKEDGAAGPGLYAPAKVFGPFRETVAELAPHIGVSIRALGRANQGEAAGRKGMLVEEMVSAKSVDFVTMPGAGGKVMELFEAARPLEVHGKGGTKISETVLTEVTSTTVATKPQEDNLADLEEAQRNLTEAKRQLEEANTRASRAEEALLLREARDIILSEVAKADLPDVTKRRVVTTLTKQDVPNKNGAFDKDALLVRVTEAVREEKDYLNAVGNAGAIRGMGAASAPDEKAATAALEKTFRSFGMSESAAKSAAEGRT